ncbi:hypothetical protein Pr1d_07360 [Bythopirellula goksoeyrii]|uniref:Uncharacterized protein n=1 Tax=Bythopirellula goksoeyrii TaxID=1400387 RepID=A0A5B9Q7R6_9BACT|nr:hypothetical protein Pr1d_07360 [Bythopirellula goksoeyrii]
MRTRRFAFDQSNRNCLTIKKLAEHVACELPAGARDGGGQWDVFRTDGYAVLGVAADL